MQPRFGHNHPHPNPNPAATPREIGSGAGGTTYKGNLGQLFDGGLSLETTNLVIRA